ncbi:MAG: hypothetical protein RLZZ540_115 [Bacteroidota bacterium]|jgi:hypothetical protein
MSLNNYFSFKRFSLLLKQDLLINRTKYLLGILSVGLIAYVFLYYKFNLEKNIILEHIVNPKSNYSDYYNVIRFYSEWFGYYMLVVGVIVGTSFPDLSDKNKASTYLLMPGSSFEKGLLQFVIRIGFFVPIALGIFWIAIRLAKISLTTNAIGLGAGIDPAVIPYFEFRDLVTDYWDNNIWNTGRILFMIFGFFSYGAYLFAGAAYFKRFALIKAVIVSVVVLGISILFSVLLSYIFYPQLAQGFDIKIGKMYFITEELPSTALFAVTLSLLSWVFFLAIAYFKLKEKEV